MGTLLLDVGGGDNLSGEVEPLTEVVKTLYQNQSDNPSYAFIFISGAYLGGEGVVVVLPGELGLDVAAGGQGLAGLDHVEVLGVNVAMLGKVEVLLGHEHTLYSQPSARLIHPSSIDRPSRNNSETQGRWIIGVHIPRKRYSWIFLRSSLGISLARG